MRVPCHLLTGMAQTSDTKRRLGIVIGVAIGLAVAVAAFVLLWPLFKI